jgi:prepilin-type N-terminal cleavage/methylation domain-containing protein
LNTNFRKAFGFTLVELLVVLAVIGILVSILLPNITFLINKADGVVCNARLRNLWIAFSAQLNDGNGWPQIPPGTEIGSMAEQQWWLTTTSNSMGLTKRDWNCPTTIRNSGRDTNSQQVNLISYLPTLFDAKPMTPSKWPRMPWFTEAVGMHGQGHLSVRADGSVCPVQDQ